MTDISKDDEREARKWANVVLDRAKTERLPLSAGAMSAARTILALLDRPRMPRPEDVPGSLLETMSLVHLHSVGAVASMRAAYRALYDHYNKPPAPAKVEAWIVLEPDGTQVAVSRTQPPASQYPGFRIVRLVEADSHD